MSELLHARSESERLRLFLALPAPLAVREAAGETVAALRGWGDVRWVAPDRLHLTLKFLGDTPAGAVDDLAAALEKIANKFSRFVLQSGAVGAFPNPRKPQTLWLAVGEETGTLERLAAAVEDALQPLGFSREAKKFRPHLTIGRVRSPMGLAELSRALEERSRAPEPAVEWPVEGFELIRSVLRPAGPEYTTLRRFDLK